MKNACKGWEILKAEDFRDINPGERILMGPVTFPRERCRPQPHPASNTHAFIPSMGLLSGISSSIRFGRG